MRRQTRTLDLALDPESAFAALRTPGSPAVFFDGRGGHDGSWPCRLALQPSELFRLAATTSHPAVAMRPIDDVVARRRVAGGPGGTGVAVVVAYDAFAPRSMPNDEAVGVVVLEVDAALEFFPRAMPTAVGIATLVERAARVLERRAALSLDPARAVSACRAPRTSLGRDAYLRAVVRVQEHIACGDIYQANLTQRFEASFDADPWTLYSTLTAATPAPRSAYVEVSGLALASVSPEFFVDVGRNGVAESRPIKGTRPRGSTVDEDATAAAELLGSPKDRAELVMIVDVLRNDLGRLARPGRVSVPELLALRSYPAVHHLVSRVLAELRPGVTPSELLSAVFPGGSITGAPKERAVEILGAIEPCPRGFYTGNLFWFDDDGSTASSILIRSAIVTGGRVYVGAGGGVTADSEPEEEWAEANAKARALTSRLGFDPEEAT